MKNRLLLFCFLIAGKYLAADTDDLYAQSTLVFSWAKYDAKISPAQKTAALNYLSVHSNYCGSFATGQYSSDSAFISYHQSAVHLADIDLDGDFDIVFDGKACPGMEGQVDIYLADSGSYSRILSAGGRTIALRPSRIGCTITVYQPPCCAEMQNSFCTFLFDGKTETFQLKKVQLFLTCREAANGSGGIPVKTISGGTYTTKGDSARMYWSSDPNSSCAYVPEGNTGIAITGRTPFIDVLQFSADGKWVFVKTVYLLSMQLLKFSLPEYTRLFPNAEICLYGWMRLSDLRKLK